VLLFEVVLQISPALRVEFSSGEFPKEFPHQQILSLALQEA
jgi:hypothetical protein